MRAYRADHPPGPRHSEDGQMKIVAQGDLLRVNMDSIAMRVTRDTTARALLRQAQVDTRANRADHPPGPR